MRRGMEVAVGGTPVWVDAPCAGVKMLGAGIVAALVIAQIWRLRFWRTALAAVIAVAAVCAANAARVAVLATFAAYGRHFCRCAHVVLLCSPWSFHRSLVDCLGRRMTNRHCVRC